MFNVIEPANFSQRKTEKPPHRVNIELALKNLDNPIQNFDEDLLQCRGFVAQLGLIIKSMCGEKSNVFALYGAWGSGKTSVKNLLIQELQSLGPSAPLAIEFNPWAFSGQDQVLEAFFTEIGKAIAQQPNGKLLRGSKNSERILVLGAKQYMPSILEWIYSEFQERK